MALVLTDLLKVQKGDGSKARTTVTDILALGTNITVQNNLTTTAAGDALDASQGKALKDLIDGLGTLHQAATIAARDALLGVSLVALDIVHVDDDGDGKWARYQLVAPAATAGDFVKIADEDALAAGLVATDLGYTASATNGVVTNTSGNDATLPAADGTNAGLMLPADFTKLASLSATPAASTVVNTPAGNLAATDVQGALNELQSELDVATASSHAAVTLAANTGFVLTGQEIANDYSVLPAA